MTSSPIGKDIGKISHRFNLIKIISVVATYILIIFVFFIKISKLKLLKLLLKKDNKIKFHFSNIFIHSNTKVIMSCYKKISSAIASTITGNNKVTLTLLKEVLHMKDLNYWQWKTRQMMAKKIHVILLAMKTYWVEPLKYINSFRVDQGFTECLTL